MAEAVLILGQSGTGKSYSLHNFSENEVTIISAQKTRLPFRKQFTDLHVTDDYKQITAILQQTDKKVVVIDDAQYLMANSFMRRINETGFQKFSEMAHDFWSLIVDTVNHMPADVIVYVLSHTQQRDDGTEAMKTIGKLIDEKITPEGLFNIVLKTTVSDGKYSFVTQNSGRDTVKSPEGMFSSYAINNDLKYVDSKIRSYYYMPGAKSDEEMMAEDAAATVAETKPTRRRSADAPAASPAPTETPTRRRSAAPAPAEVPPAPTEAPTRRRRAAVPTQEAAAETSSPASETTAPRRRRQAPAADQLAQWDNMAGTAAPDQIAPTVAAGEEPAAEPTRRSRRARGGYDVDGFISVPESADDEGLPFN